MCLLSLLLKSSTNYFSYSILYIDHFLYILTRIFQLAYATWLSSMPYLSNFGQLGESWTTSLAWRLEDLPMPRNLKLIKNIVCNNTICFERSLNKLVLPSIEYSNHGAWRHMFLESRLSIVQIYLNMTFNSHTRFLHITLFLHVEQFLHIVFTYNTILIR
jgi:hypothetical protein